MTHRISIELARIAQLQAKSAELARQYASMNGIELDPAGGLVDSETIRTLMTQLAPQAARERMISALAAIPTQLVAAEVTVSICDALPVSERIPAQSRA